MKKKTKKKAKECNHEITLEEVLHIYIDTCNHVLHSGVEKILNGEVAEDPVKQMLKAIEAMQADFEFEKAEAMKRV